MAVTEELIEWRNPVDGEFSIWVEFELAVVAKVASPFIWDGASVSGTEGQGEKERCTAAGPTQANPLFASGKAVEEGYEEEATGSGPYSAVAVWVAEALNGRL